MPFKSTSVIFFFALILIVAFLARLSVYFFYIAPSAQHSAFAPFLFPDSVNFMEYARALAQNGTYVDEAGRVAWRMPGYSLLLAGLLRLGLDSLTALHLPNILLGTLNAGLAGWLGWRIFLTRRAALLATVFLALSPFIAFLDGLMLSDTLAVTGVLLLCLAGAGFVRADGWKQTLRASLLVALAAAVCAYAKASAGLLLLPILPFLLFARKRAPLRQGGLGVRWGAVIAVAFAALLYPWVQRNEALLGDFVPFTTMGGFTLWEASGPGADGGANHGKVKFPPAWDDMQARQKAPGGTLADAPNLLMTYPLPNGGAVQFLGATKAELAADAYLLAAGIRELRDNAEHTVALMTRKLLRTWSPVPNWIGAPFWPYGLLMLLTYGPVVVLSILGLQMCRANWRLAYLLYLPAAYFSLVHMVFMGSVRYRVPAEACLIVVAAGVLDLLLSRRSQPLSSHR